MIRFHTEDSSAPKVPVQTSGASAAADAMIAISKKMGRGRKPRAPQAGEVAAAADSEAEATLREAVHRIFPGACFESFDHGPNFGETDRMQ